MNSAASQKTDTGSTLDARRATVRLAVAITTKDSIRTLPRVLASVEDLAERIIVVDSGSTDGTLEFARNFGCIVIERPWPGPLKQKEFAIAQALPARWMLLLDSDESLEDDLRESVRKTIMDDDPKYDGWAFNRKAWFLGGWLHHMYQPEWRTRLFRAEKSHLEGKAGLYHDRVVVAGRVGKLAGICRHDLYADLRDMFMRHLRYAERTFGREHRGGTPRAILLAPLEVFYKHGIRQRAFLDGKRGWLAMTAALAAKLMKHTYQCYQRLHPPGEDYENPCV